MVGQFKVRVWAVLGDGSTGKSTVIGNLISQLGKGSGGFRIAPLRGGGFLELYARRQSLQEAKRSPEQVVKDTEGLVRRRQTKLGLSFSYLNLLAAIRTDQVNGLPNASHYLSHFVKSGWSLESVVILDFDERKHTQYYAFGAPVCEHPYASEWVQDKSRHHWLMGPVRNHYGWA
jgi:hypothetical protein